MLSNEILRFHSEIEIDITTSEDTICIFTVYKIDVLRL